MENNISYTRNWLFISELLQQKIAETVVMCCGSGMGSVNAELLVRTGFKKLIIADGDVVESSNLNRQAFSLSDVGVNKAEALAQKLRSINREVDLKIIPKFLLKEDLEDWIPQADIVVNTIDFDHQSFIECSNICRRLNKVEMFPTNLGFGASLLVFKGNQAPTFESYFGLTERNALKLAILELLMSASSPRMKADFEIYKTTKVPYDPQLGVSSYIASSLLVTSIVRYLNEESLKVFPEVIYTDMGLVCGTRF